MLPIGDRQHPSRSAASEGGRRRNDVQRQSGGGPGDAIPDVIAARPAVDPDLVCLAAFGAELGDLVAVVPRHTPGDDASGRIDDLEVEIDRETRRQKGYEWE